MSQGIRVSVVIPAFGVENYLSECVDSVLNQSFRNIEVIIVDDGSTDISPEICDSYSVFDDRIIVIHKENGGLSSARNAGLKVLTGDYFAFLDSDDYWNDSEFLNNIFNESGYENADLILFGYSNDISLVENYKRNIKLEKELSKKDKTECIQKLILHDKIQSSACNKFVSMHFQPVDKFYFIEGIYSEDIDWTARLLICVRSLYYFDDYVYYYRANDTSITNSKKEKNIIDLITQIRRIVSLSETIKNENYYEWFMNYCSYQYITLLNCMLEVSDKNYDITKYRHQAEQYKFLLKYHVNKKVKLVYIFDRLLGFKGMHRALKIYLKMRG